MITAYRAEKPTGDSIADFTGQVVDSSPPFSESETIPASDLQSILLAGLETPLAEQRKSWRFLVIREREQCSELLQATDVHAAVEPAAILVVFALRGPWQRRAERLLAEAGRPRAYASAAVRSLPMTAWLDSQARLALSAMSHTARALGWAAGELPRVDPAAVRRALHLPAAIAAAALLTIGGSRRLESIEQSTRSGAGALTPDYGLAAS